MREAQRAGRILGLDIGVSSVGWCLLETTEDGPRRILAVGSRVFPAGVEGSPLDVESGRDTPRNQERRTARQLRRQLWRRRRRMLKVYRSLVRHGLLPPPDAYDAETIDRNLKALDRELRAKDPLRGDRRAEALFPYRLRARALDAALDPFELGRALYHLAQRRGFLSNRKATAKKDEEGTVKEGIGELAKAIADSGKRTLGEYFSSLDPEETRLRGRWLGRNEQIRPEFEAIRSAQSAHHPALSDAAWTEIADAIFRQRPLRDQSHLVARCALEPGQRRCPVAYPEAQLFRILQTVNHLRIETVDDEGVLSERALTADERSTLVAELRLKGDLTVAKTKRLLGLAARMTSLSIERGGETKLTGDRTRSRISPILGDRWEALAEADRNRLVDDLIEYESPKALERRLVHRWGLASDVAVQLSEVTLEGGHLRFSRRAIQHMLPLLESGLSVTEAKMQAYPAHAGVDRPWEILPPLKPDRIWRDNCSGDRLYEGFDVRNPAVERSLSEVRRVVNAVVRRWGKPTQIRIELGRDLKRPRQERVRMTKRIREQEGRREAALAKMVEEGFPHIRERASRTDIERVLLWEECGGICPYTGQSISFADLFGQHPRFDIEHIIPYSLSLEDGFGNKTLCEIDENRNRKRGRSPHEAYAGTQDWDAIVARVRHFRGQAAAKKLRLFLSESNGAEIFGDFAERQLNDTRYAARLAAEYVGLLYGGVIDGDGCRRVQVSAGGATAVMRRRLGLEGVLGGGEKNRRDHRHHAVDAIAIALTGPSEVKRIADASKVAIERGLPAHRFSIDAPWEGFLDSVQAAIDSMVVSHRVNHRLSGPMHDATSYSRPMRPGVAQGSEATHRHLRRRLDSISARDVESIVDPAVRAAVRSRLEELGESNPKTAFRDAANLPTLRHRDGRLVPVRRVRVKVGKTVERIGDGPSARYVAPGSNHHMAVVDILEAGRRVGRELHVVTMLEAYRRKARREPVIRSEWGEGRRLAFTMRTGDSVELELEDRNVCCIVGSVSAGLVELKRHDDARPATEIREAGRAGGRLKLTTRQFLEAVRRKVTVTPIGEVRLSNE